MNKGRQMSLLTPERRNRIVELARRVSVFVARGPVYHYTYGRWRVGRWLQNALPGSFHPDDAAFLARVDLSRSGLEEVRRAVADDETAAALAGVADYFRARTDPVFFFERQDQGALISFVPHDQREATVRAADEVCQNIFRFRRQEPVQFQERVDWMHRPQGNVDWSWDLNRHTYFGKLGAAYWYTGDEQYPQKFREHLLDWVAQNPVGVNHPNWASVFEVALRINTWIWAFYHFRPAAAFDDEVCLVFLKGLLAHGRYLDANLERHAQNNHLLLEAKALAMIGIMFPEFKGAARWRQRGLRELFQQVRAQVCPDGVHGERATHYQRVIAGELLELLVLLQNNHLPIPDDIVDALGRMVEFELWITKPDGRIPLFGDSALEDTHLRFPAASSGVAFLDRSDLGSIAPPLDEASVWLLGPIRVRRYLDMAAPDEILGSRAFPEGGYYCMRSGKGAGAFYLAFDCGPFGHEPSPNHGHADALSFDLHAFGQTLLVDPGVYSYHLGQDWRNFFRGSRAHNTVVVDDQDQSILLDKRRVYHPAQATCLQWISNDHFDFVDGYHDGYERFSQPIRHRRQILFLRSEYWVVIDLLTGRGKHRFDFLFHLMPGTDARLDSGSGSVYAAEAGGPGLCIAPVMSTKPQVDIITGATGPIQGWVSFFSGEKLPAPTLRYRHEGVAPVQFCAVLFPVPAHGNGSVAASALDVTVGGAASVQDGEVTGLCVETETFVDCIVIDRGPSGACKRFREYETDAQLLYLRHTRDGLERTKAIIHGGQRLLYRGQPLSEVTVC